MNIYNALQHAFIEYGIRRSAWHEDVMLNWDQNTHELRHCVTVPQANVNQCQVAKLVPEDWTAEDWEIT